MLLCQCQCPPPLADGPNQRTHIRLPLPQPQPTRKATPHAAHHATQAIINTRTKAAAQDARTKDNTVHHLGYGCP
eukprot:scaffold94231_cov28-Tisochrysis_lutea.AAC.1